jgi:hypothetical protein
MISQVEDDPESLRGKVIVIRYEGPKGGPGMPEMLTPTSALMGAGLGQDCALITDGRFSGGSHGFVIGHICPEAQEGGPIALVQDGDNISIDAEKRTIDVRRPLHSVLLILPCCEPMHNLLTDNGCLYRCLNCEGRIPCPNQKKTDHRLRGV